MDPDKKHFQKIEFRGFFTSYLIKNVFQITIVSLFSYVFVVLLNIFIARNLGPEQYGEISALLSITSMILVSFSAVYIVISKYVIYYKTRDQYDKIKFLIKWSFRIFYFLGFILFLLTLIFSRQISEFLLIEQNIIQIFSLLVWATFLTPVLEGFLRGMEKFVEVGFFRVIESFFRLILAGIFILIGLRVKSLILAFAIGSLLAIIFSLYMLKDFQRTKQYNLKPHEKREIYKYIVPSFAAMILLALILNIDVVLVKHFFTATEAGNYSAASFLAKEIFFIGVSIAGIMFPKAVEFISNGKNPRELVKKSLKYTAVLSVLLTLVFLIFPKFISNLFFGKHFQITSILGIYSIAILFLSIATVLIFYNLAVKRYSFVFVLLVFFLVEFVLINLFHTSLLIIVIILLIMMFLIMFAMISLTRKDLFNM